MRTVLAIVILVPQLVLSACTTQHHAEARPAESSTADARAFSLIDGRTGERLAWSELITKAAAADAVLIGELHKPGPGQAFHGDFFADVLAAAPGTVAALEFYERDHQADVDDYLSGIIEWSRLVALALGKPESEMQGHREVIQTAKRAGRPVVAANAPRRYATLARREGFERLAGLSPEQRRLFALPLATASQRYREAFFAEMGVDAAAEPVERERVEAMFRAQSLWDATMAESVARSIDSVGRPVVLVVGRFHVEADGGLVQELRLRRPQARVLTIVIETDESAPAEGVPMPERLRDRGEVVVFSRGVADRR